MPVVFTQSSIRAIFVASVSCGKSVTKVFATVFGGETGGQSSTGSTDGSRRIRARDNPGAGQRRSCRRHETRCQAGATGDIEGVFQSHRRLEGQRIGCSGDCPGTENSAVVGQQSFEHACVDDDCLEQVQRHLTGWLSWRSFATFRPGMDRETLAFYERTAAQVAAWHRASTNKDTWRRQFQEYFLLAGVCSMSAADLGGIWPC